MTGTEIKTQSADRRGGGVKAVALFWFGLLALAVGTIVISHFTLGTRDTLIRYVPDEPEIYLHAQGQQTAAVLRMIPELPELNPNEAATFAIYDNGELQWTTVLHWSFPFGPTASENNQLESFNAQKISNRTYVVGGGNFIQSGVGSLMNNQPVNNALASARGLARIQAYVNLPSDDSKMTASLINMPQQALVMAINNNIGRTTALVSDVESWNDRTNQHLVGSGDKKTPPLMLLPPEQTGVSISLNEPDDSIAEVLFADVKWQSFDQGVPNSDEQDEAFSKLTNLTKTPLSLMLVQGTNDDHNLRFAAYFPNGDAEIFRTNIVNYMDLSAPNSQTYVRPDEVKEREYLIGGKGAEFGPEAYGGIRMILTDEDGELNYSVKELDSGLILASDAEMLFSGEKSLEKDLNKLNYCSSQASETILINDFSLFEGYLPFISLFFDSAQVSNMVIQRNGDNWVYFCG